jgi:hypothetical protein
MIDALTSDLDEMAAPQAQFSMKQRPEAEVSKVFR